MDQSGTRHSCIGIISTRLQNHLYDPSELTSTGVSDCEKLDGKPKHISPQSRESRYVSSPTLVSQK